jgi:hypothetical protein
MKRPTFLFWSALPETLRFDYWPGWTMVLVWTALIVFCTARLYSTEACRHTVETQHRNESSESHRALLVTMRPAPLGFLN